MSRSKDFKVKQQIINQKYIFLVKKKKKKKKKEEFGKKNRT